MQIRDIIEDYYETIGIIGNWGHILISDQCALITNQDVTLFPPIIPMPRPIVGWVKAGINVNGQP